MKKVYTAAERKEQLTDIGAKLGAKLGVVNVQRKQIADKAGCAHSLVSVYLGDQAKVQKAIKARMKKLGLQEPAKDKIDAIGVAARKHKKDDKRDTRKRSGKEIKAIKEKRTKERDAFWAGAAKKSVTSFNAAATKPTARSRRVDASLLTVKEVRKRENLAPAKKSSAKPAVKPQPVASANGPAESKPTAPRNQPRPAPTERKPTQPASQPTQAPPERSAGELEYIPQPPLAGAFP